MDRCPGAGALVSPQIILRTCPSCGEEVEFFGYETEAKCYKCGHTLRREATSSCVTWCEHAAKCIGDLRARGLVPPSRAEELERIAKSKKSE